MANYDVVSEPDLGRSQMAWVCKCQDFRDADGRQKDKGVDCLLGGPESLFFPGIKTEALVPGIPRLLGMDRRRRCPLVPILMLPSSRNCPPLMLRLMAVSPGLGLWWFLWQGDQRLIIVTALVYSSRQKLERALRAM